MAIRQYSPTSAGRRGGSVSDFAECTSPGVNAPAKHLLSPRKKTGGRNNQGVTTTRFRGGGHKQKLRAIDFKRKKDGVECEVLTVEYDPCRSARISLVKYADGDKRYILSPDGLKQGDKLMSGDLDAIEPRLGNCLPLSPNPSRHDSPLRRVDPRPGRPNLSLGRDRRGPERPRQGPGIAAHAVG